MRNISNEIEQFQKLHPDLAKAMEIFQMTMEGYKRAYSFINMPRTYISDATYPDEHDDPS